jgi:glutathione S-transferase
MPARPILYSFRRCPYAMRARMALYVSGTECELREVVLRDKPDHMVEISPKATVPVLQRQSGAVIEESLDVMIWALEQNDPQSWLMPETGNRDAMMDLITRTDADFKDNLDRYKYPDRYDGADAAHWRTRGEVFLTELDTILEGSAYLFGSRPSLADFAIAPFIRQFANTDRDWFDAAPYPALQRWLAEFLESEPFSAIMNKYPQWQPGDAITASPVA